jgi:hypothetical protein
MMIFHPNVAKIPYRRVGCAHQISLISFVKGGQSPPYTNNTGRHWMLDTECSILVARYLLLVTRYWMLGKEWRKTQGAWIKAA